MPYASPATGSKTSHYYVEETTAGTTPTSPVWTPIRYTGGQMTMTRDSLQSSELDGSREVADLRLGSKQTAGEFSCEISSLAFNDFFEAALGGTWAVSTSSSSINITVDPSTRKFTRASGSYVTEGFAAGDLIKHPTLTGDNAKTFVVESVAALYVIVKVPASVTLTVETTASVVKFPMTLVTGSTRRSFSILTYFADADQGAGLYQLTKGVEISGFSLDVSVNALVTGTFPVIGRTTTYDSGLPSGSTFNTINRLEVYSGVEATIQDNATVLGYVTSMSCTNDNSAAAQFELGSSGVAFIERGRANNTLSLSTFFETMTLLNKFVGETETSVYVALMQGNREKATAFNYGRVVYTSGAPEVAGEESISQTLEAQALQGTTLESSIEIQYMA